MNKQEIPWGALSELYAFSGNTLLKPMNQSSTIGLDPTFWERIPDFGDAAIAQALDRLADASRNLASLGSDKAEERVSVEYTRLFIGPPSPAAAPWETFYRHEGVAVGFGEATFEMRALLREAGLELSNANRQYEDHLGIELLYLSVICSRAAEGDEAAGASAAAFIEKHPGAWAPRFEERVAQAAPQGYYHCMASLICRLLSWHLACANKL